MLPHPLPYADLAVVFTLHIKHDSLVRLHQYHDAHTVHKILVKLQPVEEKAFLAEYNAQVGRDQTPHRDWKFRE